jgi:hypothetical protein
MWAHSIAFLFLCAGIRSSCSVASCVWLLVCLFVVCNNTGTSSYRSLVRFGSVRSVVNVEGGNYYISKMRFQLPLEVGVAQRRTQPPSLATQVSGQPPLFNVSAHRACSSVRSVGPPAVPIMAGLSVGSGRWPLCGPADPSSQQKCVDTHSSRTTSMPRLVRVACEQTGHACAP